MDIKWLASCALIAFQYRRTNIKETQKDKCEMSDKCYIGMIIDPHPQSLTFHNVITLHCQSSTQMYSSGKLER